MCHWLPSRSLLLVGGVVVVAAVASPLPLIISTELPFVSR